jgi:hypothetical protein
MKIFSSRKAKADLLRTKKRRKRLWSWKSKLVLKRMKLNRIWKKKLEWRLKRR